MSKSASALKKQVKKAGEVKAGAAEAKEALGEKTVEAQQGVE